MKSTFFVYEWVNLENGMKYIGSHAGTVDDGYVGSGLYFKRAYTLSPNSFSRRILQFYATCEEMKIGEASFLKKVDACASDLYYNLTNESGGGNLHSHLDEEVRTEMYRTLREASKKWITNLNTEERAAIKKRKQDTWKISPARESHSKNTSTRRIQEELNKTESEKERFRETCRLAYHNRTALKKQKQHEGQSKGMMDFYEKNPDTKQERGRLLQLVNQGTIAINKDGKTKKIKPDLWSSWESKGWSKGMSPRSKS